MGVFIIRDVRLHGWKPIGDVIEVNFDIPMSWVFKCIRSRAKKDKNLVVKLMCHGLPGYLQFANGIVRHPQVGNGITANDIPTFKKELKNKIKRLELHACLVARIGSCHETGNLTAYDGNYFCYSLAQALKAEVKASIHIQWFQDGTYEGGKPTGDGINFGKWEGRVFTWNKQGKIIKIEDFPY